MIEHNNRKKADIFAEYITGESLRRFVADKVKYYAGDNPSVLDGAAGSGQLEQFIKPSEFEAIDIQKEACEALKINYPHASIHNVSYFSYQSSGSSYCAVMNPPFSVKFKNLPETDKNAIQSQFDWKKNGVVDDIFILKSLAEVKRFGFYIAFPGIAYRQSEKKLRELIGSQLAELITIENGFEDTKINVLMLVIDKNKKSPQVKTGIFDCKTQQTRAENCFDFDGDWHTARDAHSKEKEIDIVALENELNECAINNLEKHFNLMLFPVKFFESKFDYLAMLNRVRLLCDRYEGDFQKYAR